MTGVSLCEGHRRAYLLGVRETVHDLSKCWVNAVIVQLQLRLGIGFWLLLGVGVRVRVLFDDRFGYCLLGVISGLRFVSEVIGTYPAFADVIHDLLDREEGGVQWG